MRHINAMFGCYVGYLCHSHTQGTKGRYHSNQFWD